jgi:hypothetical protein
MSFLVSTADQALVLAFHYLAAAVVAGVVWRSSRRISRPVGRSLFRALGAIPVLREWHDRVKDHPQELDDVQTTISLLFSLAMCFANAFTHWFWAVNKAAELEVSVTNPGGTYFGVTLYTLEGVVQGLLTIAFISGGLKLFRCD